MKKEKKDIDPDQLNTIEIGSNTSTNNINIKKEKIDDDINQEKKEEKKIIGNKEKEGEIKRITREEDRVKGKLKGNVYATYFRNNGGACFVLTLLTIIVLWQGLKCGSDLWLVKWKGDEEEQKRLLDEQNKRKQNHNNSINKI